MYRVLGCALGVGDRETKKLTRLNVVVWGMVACRVSIRVWLFLCTLLDTNTLSLPHTLYFCLFRSLAISPSLSHTHALTRSRAHTHPLSHSLTHAHTRTHTHTDRHTHTHTHKHTHKHTHTNTHNTASVSRACRYMSSSDSGCQRLTFLPFLFSDGIPARRGARGHFDCGRRHRRRGRAPCQPTPTTPWPPPCPPRLMLTTLNWERWFIHMFSNKYHAYTRLTHWFSVLPRE